MHFEQSTSIGGVVNDIGAGDGVFGVGAGAGDGVFGAGAGVGGFGTFTQVVLAPVQMEFDELQVE